MSRFLYRYISFEAFVGMIQKKALTFVLPETWDDPKESAPFYNLVMTTENIYGKLTLLVVHEKTYGQCWTRLFESDAMWRIYSHNNRAIQIKASEDKLQLLSGVQLVPVVYSDETDFSGLSGVDAYLKSLATKRRAFSHENEVRLIKHYKFSDEDDVEQHIKAFLAANNHPQAIEIIDSMYPGLSFEDKVEHIAQLINIGKARRKTLDVSFDDIPNFIEGVKVHPLAPEWYVDVVREYCNRNELPFDGKSALYAIE